MKKVFAIEDLYCAHCAAKMEEGIKKIDGVVDANVNFIMQKLTIEADEKDFSKIMKKVVKVCNKVDCDCTVVC